MPFNRTRQSFTVTCGDCGDECQIPFKPRDARPVYCSDCFQDHKPEERDGGSRFNNRSSGGSRFNRGSRGGRDDRGSSYGRNDRSSRFSRGPRDDRQRETTTVTCDDCGDQCQIPFKPRDDRPVYCRECFQDHKPEERDGGSRFNRGSRGGRDDRGSSYGRNDRSSRFSRGNRDRPSFTVTCGDCGDECQVPFKPRDSRPVYCNECFQDHK